MAHTASCSNAKTRNCRCGGCAGSLHGWQGALALTYPAMAPVRDSIRAASEREWAEANASVPETKLTRRKAAAAVDSAEDDIIEWLSTALTDPPSNVPEAVSQIVDELGNVIAKDAPDALDQALRPGERAKKRAELAESHLLCSILAALACAMQEFSDDLDKLTREIATRIVTYFIGRKRINLPPFIVKVAAEATVKAVDKVIQTLAAAQHFDNLQRAVQILALLMCPAPEKHEDVVRCCFKPLRDPVISEVVQERLKAAMPDWMA
jgi:hypothetical protein